MTSYRVFYKGHAAANSLSSSGPNDWTLLTKAYDGASGDAAAKAAALDHNQPGRYAAIPARSWAPINLEIDLNPRVRVTK